MGDGHPLTLRQMEEIEAATAKLQAAFDAPEGASECAEYIRAKARLYREIGADAYRAADTLRQPDTRLSKPNLDAIRRGVTEILDGKGFSASNPLTSLPAEFSHSFALLFHFKVVGQAARRSDDGLYFLDALLCQHVIDGREVVLFNRVPGARLRMQGTRP